jgi:hypothetical protein
MPVLAAKSTTFEAMIADPRDCRKYAEGFMFDASGLKELWLRTTAFEGLRLGVPYAPYLVSRQAPFGAIVYRAPHPLRCSRTGWGTFVADIENTV